MGARRDPIRGAEVAGVTRLSRALIAVLVVVVVGASVLGVLGVYLWREDVRATRGPDRREPRPPAPDAVAVYAYGDSTMVGEPYYDALNIPKVVAHLLRDRVGARPLEVQNLAFTGNALVATPPEALHQVLAAPERFRPAALLVYLGHLEHVRAPAIGAPGAPASPQPDPDPVATRFGAALHDLAERARRAGIPLIVGVPISNTADWPPQQSPHAIGLADADARQVEGLVDDAVRRLEQNDAAGALPLLDHALALEPGYADALFLRGRALRGLGRDDEARRAFDQAVDRDRTFRATTAQAEAVRALCREGLATCVDLEPSLLARYGFLDDRLFVDAHHPNARLYALLGQGFADALASRLGAPPPPRLDPDHLPPALDVSSQELSVTLRTATWMTENAAGTRGLVKRWSLRRAADLFQKADPLATTDAERKVLAARRAILAAVQGDVAEANRLVELARQAPSPTDVGDFLENHYVREIMERAGVAPETGR